MFLCVTSFAGGNKKKISLEKWQGKPLTVVCPWAINGVVDIINRSLAVYGEEIFGQQIIATNDFIREGSITISDNFLLTMSSMLGDGGNIALTNFLKKKANEPHLIIGSENAFAVTPNVRNAKAQTFNYNDFEPIINLCSATFIMMADSKLNITNLESLKAYGEGKNLLVAVGGSTSIESFMVRRLFNELDLDMTVVAYNGANLALEALINKEVHLAISHQSQAKAGVEDGIITPVVLCDEKGSTAGFCAGTKVLGEYGYTAYCKNRSFLLARKGRDAVIIQKIYEGYKRILEKDIIKALFKDMMLEIEPLTAAGIDRHIAEVSTMVKTNM
jgi:tripartite-type tricarboxylate transporter receptor subunit TctC